MSELKIPWKSWEIIRKIGQGGYGTVYEIARTDFTGMEEHAAMKVIRFPQDDKENGVLLTEGYTRESIRSINREQLDRILDEYSLMMKMKGHRNIVRCDDCDAVPHDDEMGWDVFIRMELLKSFHQKLGEGKLSEAEIINVGKDLCRALMQCEQYGIVHRDIKPENIFVNEYGDYKLGDFGISRTMEHTMTATRTGSYKFMAPEVFKGLEYGQTVDIYSLGLVLYWLLNSYRMPFMTAESIPSYQENTNALQRRLSGNEELPMPASGSKELKAVVMKACSYRPEDRYSSAKDFFDALEDIPVSGATQNDTWAFNQSMEDDSESGLDFNLFDGYVGDPDEDKTIRITDSELFDNQVEEFEETSTGNSSFQNRFDSGETSEEKGSTSYQEQNTSFTASAVRSKTLSKTHWIIIAAAGILIAALAAFLLFANNRSNILDDAKPGSKVSATIKTIEPQFGLRQEDDLIYSYYYCKCITTDGDLVHAVIPRDTIRRYVSPDIQIKVDESEKYKKLSATFPIAITGDVEKSDDYEFMEEENQDVFLWVSEAKYADSSMDYPPFNEGDNLLNSETVGKKYHASIAYIWPESGIFQENESEYHHYVCQCLTTDGREIWAYIPCQDYKNHFDSNITTAVDENGEFSGDEHILSSEITLSGTVRRTDDIIDGFSERINSDKILEVDSIY